MNKLKNNLIVAILLFTGIQAQAVKGTNTEPLQSAKVVSSFREYVETIPYLKEAEMASLNKDIDNHINCLKNSTDKEAYITMHDLRYFIANQRDSIERYQGKKTMMIEDFLDQYGNQEFEDRQTCVEQMQAMLNDILGPCETNLNLLERELNAKEEKPFLGLDKQTLIIIGSCIGILLLLLLIYAISRSGKKKEAVPVANYRSPHANSNNNAESGIVVRRKTATILKKQSLEGVIDNPDYMKVDVEDFCYDSAVRRIYIKNTCIEELYNMYVNDQNAPEQAREYGCMVLGRWVHDAESNEYYVSLEQIVLPGDDALLEEYELNFGGKIKLKVLEELRKLRRETNLQYDLTCWVHSHPGLGIFFSNSDSSVQMQLKHPTHPNFLTAIVVDTLTPGMELGIFTFHRDTTINTKNDLKQLYSLEEWYDWAKESLAGTSKQKSTDAETTFNSDDYFSTLANASSHSNVCNGIELSNNMVVDICMALTGHSNGIVGHIHGKAIQQGTKTVYLAEQLVENEQQATLPMIGSFVVAQHCSIPSVRKFVEDRLSQIHFVLVYTPADGLLTSIPVIDNDLCTDIKYYGEHKLENLKQWTKRSR
ncbi:MAG: hypothetical protein IKM76_00955 [Prevotella sp.]|nr:hypothetical protein [Prevotella sp.]